MTVEYATYKGDEFLMIGTARECAAKELLKRDKENKRTAPNYCV